MNHFMPHFFFFFLGRGSFCFILKQKLPRPQMFQPVPNCFKPPQKNVSIRTKMGAQNFLEKIRQNIAIKYKSLV